MAVEAARLRAAARWHVPTLAVVEKDADRKDRLSFAIFWAMWKRDVSPPALAKAINKSPDTVRRYRDGESAPSVLDVGPLARALGVRPEYFTNPPKVPDYPFEDFTVESPEGQVALAVQEGVAVGEDRARRPVAGESPSEPEPSPRRRSRAADPG
jgi:hypothetical protein